MAGIADFRYRHEAPDGTNVDAEVRHELHKRTGAILIGRTMFDGTGQVAFAPTRMIQSGDVTHLGYRVLK